jgi:hypothetical protein
MFIKMDDELYHMSPSLINTCIKSVKFLACKWPLTSLSWLQQKKEVERDEGIYMSDFPDVLHGV